MAKQSKPKKQSTAQGSSVQKSRQPSYSTTALKQPQSRMRKAFTVVICVVVALGLMLPVAGLGFGSCSTTIDDSGNSSTDTSD